MSKGETVAKAAKQSKADASPIKDRTFDPVLASLFTSSSGPISTPTRRTITSVVAKQAGKVKLPKQQVQEEDQGLESDTTSGTEASEAESRAEELKLPPRKRRRLRQEDDLETSYLSKLAREEEKETLERLRVYSNQADHIQEEDKDDEDTASSASNDLEDLSDLEEDPAVPVHESLSQPSAEYEKTRRTVFLGNVSTEAIKSKSSRKQIETHLKSVLDANANETIESLRFRSTAFDVAAGPKKAAYAKKELMDETTKSTNAYVVFNTEVAARKVAKKLNGTVVLDRHLHTDWLAHPTATDHKRCVFVGNLNFVDIESNLETNEQGEEQKRRPRAKEPADSEEGLWRAFEKCGPVESVRVVRDKVTRVGKGFAYVQFSDEVGVEKALALDGKKFPPMLPRLLRVSRAKKVLKKDSKRKREEVDGSRGKRGPAGMKRRDGGPGLKRKKLDGVIFEGYRASADKGMKFKTKGKKKSGVKPTNRSSKRAAAFKAGGGKKRGDVK